MNLVWLMPNLHVTGGARAAIEISNRLVRRGHAVSIIVPKGRVRTHLAVEGRVIEIGPAVRSPLVAVPVALCAMAATLPRRLRPDAILASMPPYVLLASTWAKSVGVFAVNMLMGDDVGMFDDGAYLRSLWVRALYRRLARLSLRAAPVIANSHWTAVKCVHGGGLKPAAIIPPGVDIEIFNPSVKRSVTSEALRLVTLARPVPSKGWGDLIAALRILASDSASCELVVVAASGVELREVPVRHRLITTGSDRELAEAYGLGDVYVHTSWAEGFGLPVLEAMACGLAVVATDSGGVREFIRDGVNALLVPPRDPRALAAALRRLEDDPDLRRRLAFRARDTAAEYTWERTAAAVENFLLSTWARRGERR